jgi:hypothetical protein
MDFTRLGLILVAAVASCLELAILELAVLELAVLELAVLGLAVASEW